MHKGMIRNIILMAAATIAMGIVLGLYIQGSGPMPQVSGTRFESTQQGVGGDIHVVVTVRDGRITAVEADVSNETPGYGQDAGPVLCEAILAAGTCQGVDGVSGSTITSDAILAGVQDCMVQAGIWDSANTAQ